MRAFAHRLRCPQSKRTRASLLTLAKATTKSDGIRARWHPIKPFKRNRRLPMAVDTLYMYLPQLSFTTEPQKT